MKSQRDMTTTEAPKIWHYSAGNWTQIDDPIKRVDDLRGGLRAAGYSDLPWGWESSEIEIYGHRNGDRWIIHIGRSGGTSTYTFAVIQVSRLPDLIEVLSKVAPISTASLLHHVAAELEEVILQASESA